MQRKKIFRHGATLLILGFLALSAVGSSSAPDVDVSLPGGSVYIGLASVGDGIQYLNKGLVRLNREGREQLFKALDEKYGTDDAATTLYWAFHGIMKTYTSYDDMGFLPKDLSSAYIVTITDGVDNDSGSPYLNSGEGDKFYGKSQDYKKFIQEELKKKEVRDVPINAIAVGVPGSDADAATMTRELQALASGPENVFILNDAGQLQAVFRNITDKLTADQHTAFLLIIPSFDQGDRIRFTFDADITGGDAAARAVNYIEGEVALKGGNNALINIVYGGSVRSTSGNEVTSFQWGRSTRSAYRLTDYSGPDLADAKLWVMRSGSSVWRNSSEFVARSRNITLETSKVIFFLLDDSHSIKKENMEVIKSSVKEIINMLYEQLY
ncbi:MAG: hypothetical protein LBS57_12835 [Treponema sp.]|jgi:hypothetical protein|nr:hypothetical protein [Treponema sp.]